MKPITLDPATLFGLHVALCETGLGRRHDSDIRVMSLTLGVFRVGMVWCLNGYIDG